MYFESVLYVYNARIRFEYYNSAYICRPICMRDRNRRERKRERERLQRTPSNSAREFHPGPRSMDIMRIYLTLVHVVLNGLRRHTDTNGRTDERARARPPTKLTRTPSVNGYLLRIRINNDNCINANRLC